MKRDVKALIMCGGSGTRLAPLTTKVPKQFLQLTDDEATMIQLTANRIKPLVGSNISVVTNAKQAKWVEEQLPYAKIILEPEARNTAPAIGLGAIHMNEDDIMLVFPADHIFANEEALRERLSCAIELASQYDVLVTLGMKPTFPHTGLGHIERADAIDQDLGIFKVARFVEKPPLDKAKEYTASGKYYWNGGIFIWRVGFFLERLAACQPELYAGLDKIKQANLAPDVLTSIFPTLTKISVDYAVLEKSPAQTAVIECNNLGWNDLGDWSVIGDIQPKDSAGNVTKGTAQLINCQNCVVYNQTPSKLSIENLTDTIVVKSDDNLLICPRTKSQCVGKTAEVFSTCPQAVINLGVKDITVMQKGDTLIIKKS